MYHWYLELCHLPRRLIIDSETPAMLADVAAPRQKL